MAECKDCGITLIYSFFFATERCNKCHGAWLKNSVETNSAENTKSDLVADPMQHLKVKQINFEEKVAIDAMLLTTETAPNLNIKSRVGIVMVDADCAFDVAMVKNKNALLNKLKSEANSIGANAVVGITFDMIETYSASIGIGKVNTFKLIAYGTAVVIETEEGAL